MLVADDLRIENSRVRRERVDRRINTELNDLPWSIGHREQLARCKIDAAVGRLRGEHDGHQQLERRRVFEFGFRVGVGVA